ncbi:methionine synthase, partial [Parabacteroides sp. OttesenSCG-928-G21]|nr:methionine synthase [Parabacteroides sp. OttesenSCG-928-G21]
LFETVFDTLNIKAGLDAAERVMGKRNTELPIMLSITLSGQGGRTFSGQTLNAFLASVQQANLVSIGLNCSFGAADMKPYLKELAQSAPYYISAHPNAGLPNNYGTYDETPETMAGHVKQFVEEGLVNILGGCCGTTPAHIGKYPELLKGAKPHVPVARPKNLWLSGLKLLEIKPENNFINIGERCNVAGSRKFLRLIKEKNYDEALLIARNQIDAGAQMIDINMDDSMLNAVEEMTHFLNLIASEPEIARVPVMVDSSKWEVIEQALMCLQGKSIVNSISLKEGEEVFLSRACRIHELGAAMVVMAFDERGQADTFERKIEVCERAYRLLTEKANIPPQDIIFDPNVLSIATGIEEHNNYGLAFIQAVEWIKKNLPYAKVSAGVSNLSFSFRGNNYVREAMHAVFLYHAIRSGLDMGIVNPSSALSYDDIEPEFRTLLEDVVLNRRPDATDELIAYAQTLQNHQSAKIEEKQLAWRELPLAERLEYALVKGIDHYLEADVSEAISVYKHTVDIIDGPLMGGMNKVGELFGSGKMFLPQVVKTARTMRKAVAILQPSIKAEQKASGATSKAGKVLFATVKGDVHDIGKNIVSIVLACNNYEVIDLGVMVPADVIVRKAIEEKPDLLCLSGLITPSLDEMVTVADEMQKAGLKIPIMVGGATTSKLHTALKIAPHYDYPVIHVLDASQNPLIAAKLLHPETKEAYIEQLNKEYEELRASFNAENTELVPLSIARQHGQKITWMDYQPKTPDQSGVRVIPAIPIEEVIPYINWVYFFNAWKLSGKFAGIAHIDGCDVCRASWLTTFTEEERVKASEAMQLYKDAQRMLDKLVELKAEYCKAIYGIFPAYSKDDTLFISDIAFPMLRQQTKNKENQYTCLADFVMPENDIKTDFVGAFAVTGGSGADYLKSKYEAEGDSYNAMLLQTLTDRLAEATAEYLHKKVRTQFWGYDENEQLSVEDMFKAKYLGIRPAIGYPAIPDQMLNASLNQLLDMSIIGIELTENGAMLPTAAVSGLYLAHPEASYFMVGKIDEEQLLDYASRRNITEQETRTLLSKNII